MSDFISVNEVMQLNENMDAEHYKGCTFCDSADYSVDPPKCSLWDWD